MRKLITILFISVLFVACKKDTKNDPAPLQIVVTGLTNKTDLSIEVTNQNKLNVLTVIKQFGNKTYETAAVNSGDVLTVHYSSNMNSSVVGDGVCDIVVRYKTAGLSASGGDIGGATGKTLVVKIP